MSTYGAIAYTPSVRAVQIQMGSPVALSSEDVDAPFRIGPGEAALIAASDGFFQATTSETGWPYVQLRGGPPGFAQVLTDHQVGYADLRGNRQYISVGNLSRDDRVALFFIDYASQQRLKLFGRATLVEEGPIVEQLAATADGGRVERAVVIDVIAGDWNCRQHIRPKWTAADVERTVRALEARIDELELQLQLAASAP